MLVVAQEFSLRCFARNKAIPVIAAKMRKAASRPFSFFLESSIVSRTSEMGRKYRKRWLERSRKQQESKIEALGGFNGIKIVGLGHGWPRHSPATASQAGQRSQEPSGQGTAPLSKHCWHEPIATVIAEQQALLNGREADEQVSFWAR